MSPPLTAQHVPSATATAGGKRGRTGDGTAFAVPETRDFLENLQQKRHNVFEKLTLALIGLQLLVYALHVWYSVGSRWYFAAAFVAWRLSYNGGIGYLLHTQSHSRLFVRFTSKLLAPDSPTMPFFRRQLTLKMGRDYDFDVRFLLMAMSALSTRAQTVPMEYNCWLVFRGVVDVILLNDFTAYMIMVFAFLELPKSLAMLDVACYVVGVLLCVFNWFIKLDALRVVKDYAWYWGDFFFLLDGTLSFDGVFKIAPHPMYSIGYIGYYGMSLISRSYIVLYLSLGAHLCQFLFLALVENPHIDKVYKALVPQPPAERRRRELLYEGPSAYFRRDLIGWRNFDAFRAADMLTAAIVGYNVLMFAFGAPAWFHVLHCIFWRLAHSVGLGLLLRKQSETKFWTAHFVKFGYSLNDAFANWKSLYNLSLSMTHVSFFFCTMSFYHLPDSWLSGSGLLKHTLALLLMALHVWAASEVYEVIRDYGWFYGDFFLPRPGKHSLSYSGIYRFVNNPEKVLCHAAFWALAVLSDSFLVYALALFSQCATFFFIHYVEQPHMKKIYGGEVRQRAGFEEGLLETVKPPPELVKGVVQFTRSGTRLIGDINAKALREVTEPIEQLVDMAKPRLRDLVHDLSDITRRSVPLPDDVDASQYMIAVVGGDTHDLCVPVELHWTAPANHSDLDWIGIYPVHQGHEHDRGALALTTTSSEGRWVYLGKGGTAGTVTLKGAQLPVVPGTFEARLHYDNHHGVLARSQPFTIAHFTTGLGERVTVDQLQAQLVTLFRTLFADAPTDQAELAATPFADLTLHLSREQRRWRAQAVVRFIRAVHAVEFHTRILESYPTATLLACKLHEARLLLAADGSGARSSDDDEPEELMATYQRLRRPRARNDSESSSTSSGGHDAELLHAAAKND